MRYSSKRHGFTLIELSIVMAIVALIIGAILYGKSLERTSELNAIVNEVAQYQQAFKDFQDRYTALPGDMYNATSYWGADSSCPSTAYTASPHITTCNGNGDGQIGGTTSTYYELFRAWQQLSNAGMIKGDFNGIAGTGASGYESLPSFNVPTSRYSGGAYSLFNSLLTVPGNNWTLSGHILIFGSAKTNDVTRTPNLSPLDAANLDKKVDDGLPGYGKVLSQQLKNCVTNVSDPTVSQYYIAYKDTVCDLIFSLGF